MKCLEGGLHVSEKDVLDVSEYTGRKVSELFLNSVLYQHQYFTGISHKTARITKVRQET